MHWRRDVRVTDRLMESGLKITYAVNVNCTLIDTFVSLNKTEYFHFMCKPSNIAYLLILTNNTSLFLTTYWRNIEIWYI